MLEGAGLLVGVGLAVGLGDVVGVELGFGLGDDVGDGELVIPGTVVLTGDGFFPSEFRSSSPVPSSPESVPPFLPFLPAAVAFPLVEARDPRPPILERCDVSGGLQAERQTDKTKVLIRLKAQNVAVDPVFPIRISFAVNLPAN